MTEIEKVIEEVQAETMPFESWERIAGESSGAFLAFCFYRDLGLERNIRKAVETAEKDEAVRDKRYRVWRNWSMQYRWRERVAGYDKYIERLKQAELRKPIEAQGEKHRAVTGKMLDVVQQKLDGMNPADLSQTAVNEWVQTAIKSEREMAGLTTANGKPEPKQGELNFVSDFQGI
jgi:hypothetical protein